MGTGGRRLSASGGRRGARQAVRQWRPVQHRSPPAGAGPSLVSQSASPSLPERAAPPAGPAGPRALGGTRHCGRGGCPGVQGPEASARATRRLPLCSGSESGVAPGITWGSGGRGGLAGGRPLSVPCLPFASQPAHRPCPRCPGSAVHVGAAQWAQWLRWDPGLRGVSAGTCPGQGQGHEGARLTLGADAASAAPRQVTTDLRQRCTDGHTGTSVSAPMAAGIIALALEAK